MSNFLDLEPRAQEAFNSYCLSFHLKFSSWVKSLAMSEILKNLCTKVNL